jgi:hypothetical protein
VSDLRVEDEFHVYVGVDCLRYIYGEVRLRINILGLFRHFHVPEGDAGGLG